ncbi:hypothetical protein KLNKPBOH_01355 [Aeromonas veronii]
MRADQGVGERLANAADLRFLALPLIEARLIGIHGVVSHPAQLRQRGLVAAAPADGKTQREAVLPMLHDGVQLACLQPASQLLTGEVIRLRQQHELVAADAENLLILTAQRA